MVRAEQLVGSEWAEWYRLTPIQRWLESEKLWMTYMALGVLTQLMLEGQTKAVVEEVLGFSSRVGLPVTFAEIGIGNPGAELLEMVARRATAAGETIHNEPFAVTVPMVVEAMRAADSAGAGFLRRNESESSFKRWNISR